MKIERTSHFAVTSYSVLRRGLLDGRSHGLAATFHAWLADPLSTRWSRPRSRAGTRSVTCTVPYSKPKKDRNQIVLSGSRDGEANA
jgi:hypothetical protein